MAPMFINGTGTLAAAPAGTARFLYVFVKRNWKVTSAFESPLLSTLISYSAVLSSAK
jgi:hypothetical protein